ncbi:hypothetical protein [Nonomuraea sp. NPDC003709]|uniref:hypothetical protein n=1 Tax=Nonomuraea sp. NPDC003709 TaxID=3154450 RepID=UPI0033BB2393
MSAADLAPTSAGKDPGALVSTEADRRSMSRNSQLLIAWCGPAMVVLFLIGSVWLARYFPPAIHPSDSAQQVAQYYQENATAIRVGLVFSCLAYALMGVWGVCMAVQTRRKEGLFPALTYVQLTCMAAGTAQIVVNCGLWATAAFRAGEVSPEITQAFNDAAYIILLGTWMPFTIWAVALGLNILLDKTDAPVFPRWTGYFSIWAGVCFIPGGTVWFFKDGPFGWTGVVCLWVPFVVFGIWVLYFSYLSMRNVRGGFVHEQEPAADS